MIHLLLFAAASLQAQQVIGTATTQEVLLDMVVRDSKGRLVKDLRADELTVLDNGIAQSVRAFRLLQGSMDSNTGNSPGGRNRKQAPQAPSAAAATTTTEPRLVTIAFDQLRPEQRPVARKVAREALRIEGASLYFAVFTIDQRLAMLAPYTINRDRIERAIDRASGPLFSLNTDERERIERQQDMAALAKTLEDLKGQGDPGMPPSSEQRMVNMTLNMLQFADNGGRTQQGRAQFLSLWSLVKEQKRLPGRKTLLYLTGGMSLPPGYAESFRTLISDANKANVTIYAIDVSGLSTYDANASGSAMLRQAASSSRTNMLDRSGVISTDQAQLFDRAELAAMSNLQTSLDVMSRDTGGFMTANTNDFRSAVRRIGEEATTHYELAYAPHIDKYDGLERRISVTVSRPGITVKTRSGYFAVPPDK
jgi:VWFA-related protein